MVSALVNESDKGLQTPMLPHQPPALFLLRQTEDGAGAEHLQFRVRAGEIPHQVLDHPLVLHRQAVGPLRSTFLATKQGIFANHEPAEMLTVESPAVFQ